jgi:hypothetical protein
VNIKEWSRKKVIGVPLLYWGLAAAAVLAYVAYKTKSTVTGGDSGDGTATGDTSAEAGSGGAAGDLSSLNTTGTVVVQPQTQPVADAVEETNDTWLQAAVDYVVNDAKIATYGDAQAALVAYLNGDDLTFDQGKIRDAALSKVKLPPEGVAKIGVTGTAPAQKQFTSFPGKHTVKGTNDNTAAKLATLYYGNGDALHADRISELNTTLGPNSSTFSVGTVVSIPPWTTPAYYTVTGKNGDTYYTYIASKHGVSVAMLQALNPSQTVPLKVGTKVRTQ